MPSPLVSVIIPVRNYERYIGAAIECVLAQKFTDYELIIVDDCSTDRTPEIVAKYVDGRRVRSVRNETRLGQFPTHNRGAEHASGKYLKFFHGDDIMYPHCLEMMVMLMEAFPAAGLGISYNPWPWMAPHLFSPLEAWQAHVAGQTGMFSEGPSGTIFRAEAFRRAGRFADKYHTGDSEMSLRVAMEHPVLLLPLGLWWYRIHGEQIRAYVSLDTHIAEGMMWMKCLLSDRRNPLPKNQKAQAERRLIRDSCRLVLNRLWRGKMQAAWSIWRSCGLSWANTGVVLSARRTFPLIPVEVRSGWSVFPGKPSVVPSAHAYPSVSVFIPAYNAEEHLAKAIESALAQRFTDWELIIVDDASTDRTGKIARTYADGSRIRYFRNEANLGKWPNHNRCVELARGKYIKFLHADDLLYPHCLEIMVEMMERYPEAMMGVSGNCGPYWAGVCLNSLTALQSEFFGTPRFLEGMTALIIRSEALKELGGIEPTEYPVERMFQLRLANRYPVVLMDRGLIHYRRYSGHPYLGFQKWTYNWAEGYSRVITWLQSPAVILSDRDRHLAIGNLLRYVWQRGDVFHPHSIRKIRFGERIRLLRLGRWNGIPWRDFVLGPPRKRGWTSEMEQQVRQMTSTLLDGRICNAEPQTVLNHV